MDEDLDSMSHSQVLAEAKKLRAAVRAHRDSTGQGLCWHQPALWDLLPDRAKPTVVVPEWPQFMRGCVKYRQSLDQQLPNAQRTDEEFKG